MLSCEIEPENDYVSSALAVKNDDEKKKKVGHVPEEHYTWKMGCVDKGAEITSCEFPQGK